MLPAVKEDERQGSESAVAARPAPETKDREGPRAGVRRPWSRVEVLILFFLIVIAAFVRLWDLGDPDALVFDETYYAKDACWYAFGSEDACEIGDEQTKVHPPLGKYLLSAGVKIFGYDSFGWRVSSAVAGVIGVVLLFILARRLFRSVVATAVAAGLFAIDFLHIVQSRVAMLDVFTATLGLAAVTCLVMDRDRILLSDRDVEGAPFARPWRAAAGLCAGGAVATKWSGALVLVALLLLTLAWETAARRDAHGYAGAFGRVVAQEGFNIFLYLVVLPGLFYMLTFLGRLDGEPFFSLPWSEGSWFRALIARHDYMLDFHRDLDASHSYQSPAWSWPLIKRPVSYYFCSGAACTPPAAGDGYQEILAFGSPFVWWSALVSLVWAAVAWVKARDPRRPEGLILAGFVLTFVPWMTPLLDRPAMFIFYLLPALPFMYLALGFAADRIGRTWEAKAAVALFVAGAIGFFVYFHPLIYKRSLSQPDWGSRMWFEDCDERGGDDTTEADTDSTEGTGAEETATSEEDDGAPAGWCWI